MLYTKDERDSKNPVKQFPDTEYLRYVVNAYWESDRLFIPKSRQIKMSWLACAIALHRALFYPHSNIFIQSKKEEDAAMLVFFKKMGNSRISFIYDKLPDWVKAVAKADGTYSKINFSNGSQIWGIPEGGHIIRSHTASLFIGDESAFQPEFESAYTAAMSCSEKIICISSAGPGYFEDIVTEVI
jgi:hypothetical protein